MRVISALILVVALAACGDDGGTPVFDAATIDAAVAIDSAPDSGNNACTVLCDCAVANCQMDRNQCETECPLLPASVRACRITHCGYAQEQGGASTHCPHVAGDTTNQTTPAECIFEIADAGP